MTNPIDQLAEELAALEGRGLLRSDAYLEKAGFVVLCSNDYLGLGALPIVGAGGAGAARLVSGDQPEHRAAESALASWLETESALLFSSGFAANTGVVAALAGAGDLIVSDRLNHASIVDGCRLSRADVAVVAHCDVSAVDEALRRGTAARRRWVVTEAYFSMDGDGPDLAALADVVRRHDAGLIVDEAHSLGVFGPRGRGRCAEAGVVPDVLVGTLGKAFGLQGAFVAGSATLRRYLWNRARSFVFSTGLAPAIAGAVSGRLERLASGNGLRARLSAIGEAIRGALPRLPATVLRGPILPHVVGSPEVALAASAALRARGVLVQAIRPPTVPDGSARLRLTACAGLGDAEVELALEALREVLPRF